MADKILMLALSPTMETGTIARWNKHEGDEVHSGDILCEVETDKATMDYESIVEGTLLKIVAPEGSQIKVGDCIAITGTPGEDISSITSKQLPAPAPVRMKKGEAAPQQVSQPPEELKISQSQDIPSRSVKASPLAREIARQNHIDLETITGTGPGGRVVKEDVERVMVSPHKVPGAERIRGPGVVAPTKIPISEKRRVIAQRLSDSMFTAPHFYMTVAVAMDRILSARKELNARTEVKVSLNAFIIKIVAEVLRRHPVMLTSWSDDAIVQYESVDIAVAVALKDGLITPVIKNCTDKGIKAIDQELGDLVRRARDNKLRPEEYTGAVFTISNLGSYGIRQFTAIINPPGSSILAVGEIFKELIVDQDDNESIRSTMLCTLSCDHRVIDGAVAAEFARDLKQSLDDPLLALY